MSGLKIMVCMKQVLDTRLTIEVSDSGDIMQKSPWPVYMINPADRCGLEEAIRLRDEISGSSVTTMTLGPERDESVLAHCLAKGADEVVHLLSDEDHNLDSFSVARALSAEIRKRGFDLIICGNKTENDGASEVGPFLAELLDIAQVTNVVNFSLLPQGNKFLAERKLERGYRQTVEVSLPALITVDSSICQPRYVTVRAKSNWAKSLSQHVDRIYVDCGLLNSDFSLREVVGISSPRPRPKKINRPDAEMSSMDRLAFVMGLGTSGPPKPNQRTTGRPDKLADEIIDFLKEKGLLQA